MGVGHTQVLAAHTPAFVRGVAAGIEHLHVLNIIHRDIKPENIFVCADFSIRVGDFGQVHGMRQSDTQHLVFVRSCVSWHGWLEY